MRKIIIGTMLVSSIVLTSCSFIKQEPKTPEDILKQTQSNLINDSQKSVLLKKKAKFDGNLQVDAKLPTGSIKGEIKYEGKGDNTEANVKLDIGADVIAMGNSFKVIAKPEFIITLQDIYMKLSKLDLDTTDVQLKSLLGFVSNFTGKWFFLHNKQSSIEFSRAISQLEITDQIKETPLFKIDKVISDHKFEISLDKENLKNLILEINKSINKDVDINEMKEDLNKAFEYNDVKGVIEIDKDNLHFVFNGQLISRDESVDVSISYTDSKFYIKLPSFVIDLKRDGDRFDGIMSVMTPAGLETVNIKGELTSDKFDINVKYNKAPIDIDFSILYKAKEISDFNIKIPQDASDLEAMFSQFMPGITPNAGGFDVSGSDIDINEQGTVVDSAVITTGGAVITGEIPVIESKEETITTTGN